MGKISKMLEKSGYTIDRQEIETPVDAVIPPELSPVKEKRNSLKSDHVLKDRKSANKSNSPSFSHPQPSAAKWDERLMKATRFSHGISEEFRKLRAKILVPQNGQSIPRTIMISSALPSEGKSFITANLGIALAQGVDQHSLLVDCDLRHPTLASLFGASQDHGLADYLRDEQQLEDLIQKTAENKLSILASGTPPANPAELLGSARMHDLVAELSLRYSDRFVIFDTPPLQVASESMVLSQAVDGVILVVRYGGAGRSLITKFINDIGKEKIIGVIFNGHKQNPISSRLVDGSHYYYTDYYNKEAK